MVAKPSIWSVHWRIYACLFALDFTVISLISKLLTPLYMWSLFVVLNPGSLPGLSNAPVRLTAQPAPKKAIVTAIDFCSTLIMWELFATRVNSLHLPFRFTTEEPYSSSLWSLGGSNRSPRGFFSLLSLGVTWGESWIFKRNSMLNWGTWRSPVFTPLLSVS